MITGTSPDRLVQDYSRLEKALRPQTAIAYTSKFKLYLAYASWYQFQVDEVNSVLAFSEFMAQYGSRAQALVGYIVLS